MDKLLRLQFAIAEEKLEELQITDHVYAITSPVLIPLSEPQQGSNLIMLEAVLCQIFCFQNGRLSVRSYV